VSAPSVHLAVRPHRRWWWRAGCLAVLVAGASALSSTALPATLVLATVAWVLVTVGRRAGGRVRAWPSLAAAVLPRAERAAWTADVRAVLHAAAGPRERRRQAWGFLCGLPATTATSWYLALAAQRSPGGSR
jgi:hypothetical protein